MTDTGTRESGDRLEVSIYQLAPDDTFKKNRTDGAGWDWSWANVKRDWMDETSSKFAYRCLPLAIANQIGWWILQPDRLRCGRGAATPTTAGFGSASIPPWPVVELDNQPLRLRHHHLEDAVFISHQAGGIAAAGWWPGQLLQARGAAA